MSCWLKCERAGSMTHKHKKSEVLGSETRCAKHNYAGHRQGQAERLSKSSNNREGDLASFSPFFFLIG